eukprot:gb/GECH01007722.1/.p1 GENE.gb/GECH01007722.1/~~gb/GECH01007722.1/.p1  ORF type:complete len:224 (+),score=40.63 gb/GECH01007722.1/:1-672(+)
MILIITLGVIEIQCVIFCIHNGNNLSKRHIFITGSPGVGKTTLVKSLFEIVKQRNQNLTIGGFYTKEVRNHSKQRIGFDIVSLRSPNTESVSLSRVPELFNSRLKQEASPPRVGKYLVDVPAFESFALPELSQHENTPNGRQSVFFIDEIGKMELYSQSFQRAVLELLDNPDIIVVATVPKRYSPKSFVAQIKDRQDVLELFEVTKVNRDKISAEILDKISIF